MGMTAATKIIHPDRHILVVGLGKSGIAAVRFLLKSGAKVSVSEARPMGKIDAAVRDWLMANNVFLETDGHSAELFSAVDLVVVSPGVSLELAPLAAARRKSIPVVGELAIAAQYLKTPAVAVTGTNGKTTVTTMLGEIFSACGKKTFVGGNIGTPLYDYLASDQEADVAVVETSSFQLDTAGGPEGFRPDIALLLNISPDHLDRYKSYAAYAAAKFAVFAAQRLGDHAIMNADDQEIMTRQHLWPVSRRYFFGERLGDLAGARIMKEKIILTGCRLPGEHREAPDEWYDLADTVLGKAPNLQNSAAAILAARLMGCTAACIKKGLAGFMPLEHRMTLVAEIDGVSYYNDSKATNIGAVEAALKSMRNRVILIAGGRDKGGDYRLLNEAISQKVKAVLLIGEASDAMANAFSPLTRTEKLGTLEEAVLRAKAIAAAGDAVLLSPACASFDMFNSYGHRGEVFVKTVRSLKERAPIGGRTPAAKPGR